MAFCSRGLLRLAIFIFLNQLILTAAGQVPSIVTLPDLQYGLGSFANVAFTPDGAHFIVGGVNAQKVNVATGEIVTFYPVGMVKRLAISPNGQQFLTTGYDNYFVEMWDVATGVRLQEFSGHSGTVNSLQFSPDGRRIVTASSTQVKLWNSATGQLIYTFAGAWFVAVFSPDGTSVLTQSNDSTIKRWSVATGQLLQSYPVADIDIVFSPDRTRYITKRNVLREVATGNVLKTFGAPAYNGACIFSPDGTKVLTTNGDSLWIVPLSMPRLWDVATGNLIRSFGFELETYPTCVSFTPAGTELLEGRENHQARLWNVATGARIREYKNGTFYSSEGKASLAVSGDGKRLMLGNPVRIYDPDTGLKLMNMNAGGVHDLALTSTGLTGYSVSSDMPEVTRWNCSNGFNTREYYGGSAGKLCLALSADEQKIAAGSADKTARIWNVAGPLLQTITHPDQVTAVAFSPDDLQLLTGCKDGIVRLWNAGTGQIVRSYTGHGSKIADVAFAPDGSRIASASENGEVRIWDAKSSSLAASWLVPEGVLNSIVFSPDSRRLLTGGGPAVLWNASSGTALRTFAFHGYRFTESGIFAPNGKSVYTAGSRNVALRWDISDMKNAVDEWLLYP